MDRDQHLGKRSEGSLSTRKRKQFDHSDPGSAPQIVSRNYKTKDCQFYLRGICRKGNECTFSHDVHLVKSKVLCKFFLTDNCHKGPDCMYSHDLGVYPCRHLYIWGNCKKRTSCSFSHEVFESEDSLLEWIKENRKEVGDAAKRGLTTDTVEFYKQNFGLFAEQQIELEETTKTTLLMPGLDFETEKNYEVPLFDNQN